MKFLLTYVMLVYFKCIMHFSNKYIKVQRNEYRHMSGYCSFYINTFHTLYLFELTFRYAYIY